MKIGIIILICGIVFGIIGGVLLGLPMLPNGFSFLYLGISFFSISTILVMVGAVLMTHRDNNKTVEKIK